MSTNEPPGAGVPDPEQPQPQPSQSRSGSSVPESEDPPAPFELPHAAESDAVDGAEQPTAPLTRRQRRREKREKRSGFAQWMRELPIMLAIAFVIAVLLRSFVVQAFWIPSGSMEQTLHGCPGCTGDRILVNRMSYWFSDPEPGDVVVFQAPSTWDAEVLVDEPENVVSQSWLWLKRMVGAAPPAERDLVKRVIATEGQTIECCDAQNRVLVDGKPLNEPYIYLDGQDPSTPNLIAPFGPVTVPEGRLFVMGDHRNASADSRSHINDQHQGTVPVDAVIGRAFVILWPFDRFTWLNSTDPQTASAQAASAQAASAQTASMQAGSASVPAALLDPPVLALVLVAPIAALRGARRKDDSRVLDR